MVPAPQTSAEWCRLLMAPGGTVRRYGKDNESLGTTTVDDALAAGHTFSITVRLDVVGIDVDNPDPDVTDELVRALEAGGHEYLVFASGRPGHRHMYVVCSSEPHALSSTRALKQLVGERGWAGVSVRRSGNLRPPGVPHRLGLATSAVAERASSGAIQRLATNPPAPVQPPAPVPAAVSGEPRPLDRATFDLLVHGVGRDRYPSRSELLFRLFVGMHLADWSESEAIAALENPANRSAASWRSVLRGDPRRDGTVRHRPQAWLHGMWRDAETWAGRIRRGPAQPAEQVVGDLARWMEATRSDIRSCASGLLSSVMIVAGQLAAIGGPDHVVQSSVRALSESSCLDDKTVRRALRVLEEAGRIERVEAGTLTVSVSGAASTTPSRWRVVTDSRVVNTPPRGDDKPVRTVLPAAYVSSDVDAALNAQARYLLLGLLERPMSAQQCADFLMMSPRSLTLAQQGRPRGGALHQLCSLGVVTEKGGVYTARPNVTKKAHARAASVAAHGRRATDRRRRLRVRHRRERSAAIERLGAAARTAMHARIAAYYRDGKGRSAAVAERIADAAVARLSGIPARIGTRAPRVETVVNVGAPDGRYQVGVEEIVVRCGDAAITRRARACPQLRRVWRHDFRPYGPVDWGWSPYAFIVPAAELVARLHGLADPVARLARVVPHADDLNLIYEELELLGRTDGARCRLS